jgi:hypothetical protein
VITIERDPTGATLVHDAGPRELFSRELIGLMSHDALSGVSVVNGVITIVADNGTWKYRIDPMSGNELMVSADLIAGP